MTIEHSFFYWWIFQTVGARSTSCSFKFLINTFTRKILFTCKQKYSSRFRRIRATLNLSSPLLVVLKRPFNENICRKKNKLGEAPNWTHEIGLISKCEKRLKKLKLTFLYPLGTNGIKIITDMYFSEAVKKLRSCIGSHVKDFEN